MRERDKEIEEERKRREWRARERVCVYERDRE